MRRVGEEHLSRDHDNGDSAPGQRRAHGHLQHAGQLFGDADQLAIDAALQEQLLRVGLLEVIVADLYPRDVRRDRQHRYPAAVGVEQAVDQVQVAWPAAGRAYGQFTGHGRLPGGSEPRGLLVTHMLPGNSAVPAQRVGEPVQRVPGKPVYPPHPGRLQRRDHDVGYCARHHLLLPDPADTAAAMATASLPWALRRPGCACVRPRAYPGLRSPAARGPSASPGGTTA